MLLRRGRAARLTAAGARAAARAALRPLRQASVGPLLVGRRGAGRRITVAAKGLASPQVVLTVVGPGYAAEAPLATRAGVAAARLTLPQRKGRYHVAIADMVVADPPTRRRGHRRVR